MTKIILILMVGVSLAAGCAQAQVARDFRGYSPPMNAVQLSQTYSRIESHLPEWKADAEKMVPDANAPYIQGQLIVASRKVLLSTLGDLGNTLKAAKSVDFHNQADVAFIESRVEWDLNGLHDAFDNYTFAAGVSSDSTTEQGKIVARQMERVFEIDGPERTLVYDVASRLRSMAISSEKADLGRAKP